MEIRYPDYYKRFSCIASACPDSCCQEWEVDVDPTAADYYRHLPGALGDRLRAVLKDGEDGWASMAITEDRRCPMWRSDGLCRIQAELGHDDLCETCRNFPRLRHDYGDFMELGLELSCPEAARLILSNPDAQWITETQPGGEVPEYDADMMEVLRLSRDRAAALAMDMSKPVNQCLAEVFLYACQLQGSADWWDIQNFCPEDRLEALPYKAWNGSMEDLLGLYWEFEILTDRWKALLERGPVDAPWRPEHRALIRYFIDRYWLQAISDGELARRTKFIVVSCMVIRSLGGDPVATAQLYSKEIENSADNMDALMEALETSPAAVDIRLLNLLMT